MVPLAASAFVVAVAAPAEDIVLGTAVAGREFGRRELLV